MDTDLSFLTDQQFRDSIGQDLDELERCLDAGSWKSVHVLAGSIIEALLSDSLVADSVITRESVLKMSLSDVVDACRANQIISQKATDLSSVIRNYRNLIHPGRAIRTRETVGKESSEIARALSLMLIAEISEARRKKYGYTAEQLLTKLRSDEHSISLMPRLIKEIAAHEIERLLLELIPVEHEKNATDFSAGSDRVLDMNLRKFHALCYSAASHDIQKKVGDWFLVHIKTSDALTLEWRVLPFLTPHYVSNLSEDGKQLVRDYLLGKLEAHERTVRVSEAQVCASLAVDVIQAMKMIELMFRTSDLDLGRDLLIHSISEFPSVLEEDLLAKLKEELSRVPDRLTSSYWKRRKDLLETAISMIEIPF